MIQKKEIPADRHVFSGTAGAFFTGKAAAAVGGFLPDRGKVQMAAGGKNESEYSSMGTFRDAKQPYF